MEKKFKKKSKLSKDNVIRIIRSISIDIYKVNILVVIGDKEDIPKEFDPDKYDIKLRKSGPDPLGFRYNSVGIHSLNIINYNGKPYSLVFIDGAGNLDNIYIALVHELDHVRYRVCERLGLSCSESSAYLSSYLAESVIDISRYLLNGVK